MLTHRVRSYRMPVPQAQNGVGAYILLDLPGHRGRDRMVNAQKIRNPPTSPHPLSRLAPQLKARSCARFWQDFSKDDSSFRTRCAIYDVDSQRTLSVGLTDARCGCCLRSRMRMLSVTDFRISRAGHARNACSLSAGPLGAVFGPWPTRAPWPSASLAAPRPTQVSPAQPSHVVRPTDGRPAAASLLIPLAWQVVQG